MCNGQMVMIENIPVSFGWTWRTPIGPPGVLTYGREAAILDTVARNYVPT
jgi:hypothetical protein